MILYRITADDPTSEHDDNLRVHWSPRRADAIADARRVHRVLNCDVWVDKMEVPTGRDGLAEALNQSTVHRPNWPGELVLRLIRVESRQESKR